MKMDMLYQSKARKDKRLMGKKKCTLYDPSANTGIDQSRDINMSGCETN
jgi:hypothetical protein